jgi:cellulose biosynthesis protein BcsQ
MSTTSQEVLDRALELSGIPVTCSQGFLSEPEEWLGRARLTSARQILFLPPRQVNLVNWSGGVGKTTLGMAISKRFVQRTGLPAALLELSMGGSALHARVSENLPEFFAIATHKADPAEWQGVNLYPMDGRTIDVLWSEDPQGVQRVLAEIRRKHTLFVVDCNPGHPLFPELSRSAPGLVNLVVTSPRDDAVLQAHRLMKEVPAPAHLVLNMARSLADRAESGVSVTLPFKEGWAQSADARLADPLLGLIYSGWNRRKA